MKFRDRLVHELTQLDIRQSTRKGHNRFALGIYLQAADACAEMVASGVTEVTAFTECFSPCRDMNGVAKRLNLAVDVDRGQWWIPQS